MNKLLILAFFWLSIPMIAWADKKFIYRKGAIAMQEKNPYLWYLTRTLVEVGMFTCGLIAGGL